MEENQDNSRKKRKLLESNRILSLTALFVSVSTLFILVYQTHLSNKMYYLEEQALKTSVLPILEITTSANEDVTFQLDILNQGIGPARIKSIYILYGDSVYAMDWYALISLYINPHITADQSPWSVMYSNIFPGRIIQTGEKVTHIRANNPETASQMYGLFLRNSDRVPVNMAITYTSVYEDETWTAYLFAPFTIPPDPQIIQLRLEDNEPPAEE